MVLVETLGDQGGGDHVLLVVGEVHEEADALEVLAVLCVLLDDHLFDGLAEGFTVDYPQFAVFSHSYGFFAFCVVKERDLPKSVTRFQCLLELFVLKDFEFSLLDNEEARTDGLLVVNDAGIAFSVIELDR